MSTAYITHPLCLKHEMGEYHPERPARIYAIEDALTAAGLMDRLQQHVAPAATRAQLLRAHDENFLNLVEQRTPRQGIVQLGSDIYMNPYSYQAALHAAGAVIQGVDLVMAGEADQVFCNVRPPGHHAGKAFSMGFCIFNNVAVGALHALEHYGLQRVAIADFDVHHGNGTENIFHEDPRVMLCSTFQHPFYPYCGKGSGNQHIINVPLVAGSDGGKFRTAVTQYWLPALAHFQPELLLISAGFDAHHDDELAMLALTEADYAWVTGKLKQIANKYAQGRIVSTLEGGYALHALGQSALAHIQMLGGVPDSDSGQG